MGQEELSDEGKRMWNNLDNYAEYPYTKKESQLNNPHKTRRGRTVILSSQEVEDKRYTNMRLEIKKLLQNSKWVVADCAKLVECYSKKDMFFAANEAKTAMIVHQNLILRLERVLANMSAFEEDFNLDNEDNTSMGNNSVGHALDNDEFLNRIR